MTIRKLVFVLLIIIGCTAAAQAQCGTRNARAFLEVRFPGNIPVDENRQPMGKRVDSTFTLYLESPAKDITGSAWIGGRLYNLVASPVDAANALELGKEKRSGKKVVLTKPAAHRTLWRLELQPAARNKKAPAKAGANQVLLQLNAGGKKCIQTIRPITELAVLPSV
jgi:hypothetical protein